MPDPSPIPPEILLPLTLCAATKNGSGYSLGPDPNNPGRWKREFQGRESSLTMALDQILRAVNHPR